MLDLKALPYPNVIETLNYDEILNSVKNVFKEYLTDDEIALLESDSYSALLETLAYRELLLRARINQSVKSMLLPFATGSDLDNVVAIYGIERLKGEKPTANVKFSLSTTLGYDVYIPAGLTLVSKDGDTATLKNSLVIKAGNKEIIGVSVLDSYVKSSLIKCELIQTPLPFVLTAKQESEFLGGAERESDDRLRERAVLSLERFSTAGSAKAYIYQAMSANIKVLEVSVLNGGAGIVKVYLKTADMSEETRTSVADYLNDEKVRPLTDSVIVTNANIINIEIKAELELTDMFMQDEIDKAIKATPSTLKIGENLNLSYIYSVLHKNGVYRVNLQTPTIDTKVGDDSFARISFNLSYKKASL
ncbi:baseplate J/gp47 family protein [Campylobacter sp. RM9344]|uniref:Baseplate J/gp47 family protein n=1 Tax=Campylobacter californiensis TaxID=1032243 RepID=A0AAW3ZWM2_9BACT|nr:MULTISPECIES: baseplate J/gp47 family protein [unclassified Campylobacter]MBE2985450.1 baseplate J/gp47 family protein [Campylobacter sp. RM6883]MBE2994560.1 baseplate J/gp47 family protein [Campylobacter sp. RM6913]MBE3029700.1 baseplate J/gp47 family protein [Campylobacter sp. RM9344]MBE3607185.1 baseplate J/gp47 family protein [Campylobacter sp. RM9337]MBE3609515.1 baseplate J/gp47 family protein [Campylobacter sp. RM12916]